MDAFARLEPLARPLLGEVDAALATLGAPAGHPVWRSLRVVGATPFDAVAYVADLRAGSLRDTAAALRLQAGAYRTAILPREIDWSGAAGDSYGTTATALTTHLNEGMLGRVEATATFLEETANWMDSARDRVAGALADMLSSMQAVEMRVGPALGRGVAELARASEGVPARTVLAAADIGVCLLDAVGDALADGQDVFRRWSGELSEIAYQPPAFGPSRFDATVRLRQ